MIRALAFSRGSLAPYGGSLCGTRFAVRKI